MESHLMHVFDGIHTLITLLAHEEGLNINSNIFDENSM